jgi:hypothetical protein
MKQQEFKNPEDVREAMALVQRVYRRNKKLVYASDVQSRAQTTKQPPHPELKPNEVIVNEL